MPAGAPPNRRRVRRRAYLALHPAGGFRRWTALDGFVARKDANGSRRKRGLTIGLTSLGVASVLELILLLQVARSGRKLKADAFADIDESVALMKRSSAVSVVIGAAPRDARVRAVRGDPALAIVSDGRLGSCSPYR